MTKVNETIGKRHSSSPYRAAWLERNGPTKTCRTCGETKPIDSFYTLRGSCIPCVVDRATRNEAARPREVVLAQARIRARRHRYKKEYGITFEDFDRLFVQQNGRCAICQQTPETRLHVDHDHSSGQVRGLLCDNCNRGIGCLKDDPERLEAAAQYLREVRHY